ncbi:MAG TPA: flagellar basal body P-ring formation chaperone FlgA [Caulobacteraceae bacterium]|nr:flagellar basal body P-ring formation chaperone FlgA [Caulobacteraceae bacterium]
MPRGFAVACLLALMSASPAVAAQPVQLRASPEASGPITLGALFDGAGAAAGVVVGTPAPPGQSAVLDAGVVQRIARDHGLDWENPAGMSRILVANAGGAATPAVQEREALTYSRSLAAGEVIQPGDLVFAKVPRFQVPADAPRDAVDVIGKLARQPLRAGAPVATHELTMPLVIKRDDVVQVSYRDGGVSLVLQGKAMGDAATGAPVAIQNTNSKKVIQAVATGVDQAVVGPEAEAIRAAQVPTSSQVAAIP